MPSLRQCQKNKTREHIHTCRCRSPWTWQWYIKPEQERRGEPRADQEEAAEPPVSMYVRGVHVMMSWRRKSKKRKAKAEQNNRIYTVQQTEFTSCGWAGAGNPSAQHPANHQKKFLASTSSHFSSCRAFSPYRPRPRHHHHPPAYDDPVWSDWSGRQVSRWQWRAMKILAFVHVPDQQTRK